MANSQTDDEQDVVRSTQERAEFSIGDDVILGHQQCVPSLQKDEEANSDDGIFDLATPTKSGLILQEPPVTRKLAAPDQLYNLSEDNLIVDQPIEKQQGTWKYNPIEDLSIKDHPNEDNKRWLKPESHIDNDGGDCDKKDVIVVRPPMFLPLTHFKSQTPKDELWKKLQTFLEKNKAVDFEIARSDAPNSPEGVNVLYSVFHAPLSSDIFGSCQFNVQIFSQPDPKQFLIEFQYRSGCRWSFHELYRQALVDLKSHNIDYKSPIQRPEIPKNKILLDPESFECIYNNANSEILDRAQEGMETLAEFSYLEENRRFLEKSEFSSKMIHLIRKTLSKDRGDYVIHRYSTVIAKNLSLEQSFKAPLSDLKDAFIEINEGRGSNSNEDDDYHRVYNLYLKDMKRHIATILDNISS